jgi:hypothetical protein
MKLFQEIKENHTSQGTEIQNLKFEYQNPNQLI